MSDDPARILRIWQEGSRDLAITWTSGETWVYDVVALRRACPCAHCVSETSGERLLDPASVPDSVRPVRVASIGTYALTVAFSDGHDTGIYPLSSLRDEPSRHGGRRLGQREG